MEISQIRRETDEPVNSIEKAQHLQIGELLVAHLEQLGVKYVFGVPGGAVEPFYNAMARSERRGGLRVVAARNETGAVYMAEGYAKESGKLGVCVATTGPGTTNLITGVCSAYLDEVPMLVITGLNTPLTNARAAFQDSSPGGVDTVALFKTCTRYSATISRPEHFEQELYAALTVAYSEQRGPVHLAIPVDVLSTNSNQSATTLQMPMPGQLSHPTDIEGREQLLSLVKENKKFTIVIGESCGSAINEIIQFAEVNNVHFVCLPAAKGFVDPAHKLYRGVFGFAGHFHARETLIDPELDFVLVLGSALSEWDTAKWDKAAIFNSRLIHIDPVIIHHAYTPMAAMHLRCDIKALFTFLNAQYIPETKPVLMEPTPPRYEQISSKSDRVHPAELMRVLGTSFPNNSRFFIDAGNSMSWGLHHLNPSFNTESTEKRAPCWFHISMRFAAMGWGIGNAVGAAMAKRDAATICVTGDGSYLMNGQELSVAIAEHLPMVFIVLNDSSLGMVKHGQRLARAEPVSYQLPCIDFAAIAKAMGANGIRCYNIQDIKDIDFDAMLKLQTPTLIDVIIDEEADPPMHDQVKKPTGVSYA